jgi:predicted GNAT family acetyltransferase
MASDYTVTRDGEDAGAFLLRHGAQTVGRLDFRVTGAILDIDYVVVDGSLRGRGFGKRLVDAAVDWARHTNRTVRPFCGYAARVLRGDARYRDVLSTDRS